MCSPTAFMLQRKKKKKTHYVIQEHVCVLFCQHFSYIIQSVESERGAEASGRASDGLSLMQLHLAGEELSVGPPSLMRSGATLESGGRAVIH